MLSPAHLGTLIGGVVLALVALYFLYAEGSARATAAVARASMFGVWTGSPEYCKRANLASMTFMLLPPGGGGGPSQGYLLVTRDDQVLVSNQAVAAEFAVARRGRRSAAGSVTGTMEVRHMSNRVWPSAVRFALHPEKQRLQIYDKGKTWGLFYKDAVASSILTDQPPLEA